MDILKQQWARIQEQFNGLTATQKMLAGSLVAIMVLTMMLWGRYATTADMVPVLNSSFDDTQIVHATMALKAEGIDSTVSGDRIMVPADKHDQALAILSYEQLLPADSKSGFDDIIKETNPFDTDKKSDLMFTRARAAELAQIINDWHGVADAKVVINPIYEKHIGDSLKPGAVVSIRTRGGEVDIKHMVDSAASTVASSTSGMDRSRVSVIIDGRAYKPHDDAEGGLGDGELYEQTEEQEHYIEDKIAKGLANYTDPLISVSVSLDVKSTVATSTTYDPTKSVQKETSTDSKSDESSQASSSGGEPGAVSNTGLSVNTGGGGGGGNTSTVTEDKSEFQNAIASTVETTNTPAGQQQVVSAAVGLPRSHFVDLYTQMNPTAKAPDDDTLRKWAEPELNLVKHQVQSACGLKSDDNIFVDLYADAPVQAASDTAMAQAGTSITLMGHVKEIAIGALAMLSLFMVSMMVRKGAPVPVAVVPGAGAVAADVREVTSFSNEENEVTGFAGDAQNAMDGMELDDETMKSQQVVEQVTTMVKENPDAAAALVKRWLNRT